MSTSANKAIDWDKLVRLFVPGSGIEPPLLAGREEPLKKLADLIGYLQEDNSAAPGDAVLFGPRGNGKTILLNAFGQQSDGKGIDILSLKGKQVSDEVRLATYLLRQREVSMKDTEALKLDKGKVGLNFVSGELSRMNREDRETYITTHLFDLLATRCRNRPLLMIIDEAHTLDFETGGLLLNTSQAVRETGAPFLLVLAGTPNLRDHLDLMSATFWDRAEIISVGRLDSAATRAALLEPLKDFGISVEHEALETVGVESQRYPYFIQAWGKALCLTLRDRQATHIDTELVDAARPVFAERRTDYYEKRYEELTRQNLLEPAKAVSAMFQDTDLIDSEVLQENLVAALSPDLQGALDMLRKLSHLGFIWKPPASIYYEPGIPSLMGYVLTGRGELSGDGKSANSVE